MSDRCWRCASDAGCGCPDVKPTFEERHEALLVAADEVELAITDKGPVPTYHDGVMARHRREWPTLWRAIDTLLKAIEEDRRNA